MISVRLAELEDTERISLVLAVSWKAAYKGIIDDDYLRSLTLEHLSRRKNVNKDISTYHKHVDGIILIVIYDTRLFSKRFDFYSESANISLNAATLFRKQTARVRNIK